MSERSVFVCRDEYPFVEELRVRMEWFPGFALSQKRKCELNLHANFNRWYPGVKCLEISSASLYSLGAKLSAMELQIETDSGMTSVESAFQSSRIYEQDGEVIGPFPEYLFLPGRECKKLVKEQSRGLHAHQYCYQGQTFPVPRFNIPLFYNYVYIHALTQPQNRALREALLDSGCTAFTDLATSSINSQARAAAIFVSLARQGLLDQVQDYDSYLTLFRCTPEGKSLPGAYDRVQVLDAKGQMTLLTPVLPGRVTKTETEEVYASRCAGLTNKKGPGNFLDTAEKTNGR